MLPHKYRQFYVEVKNKTKIIKLNINDGKEVCDQSYYLTNLYNCQAFCMMWNF